MLAGEVKPLGIGGVGELHQVIGVGDEVWRSGSALSLENHRIDTHQQPLLTVAQVSVELYVDLLVATGNRNLVARHSGRGVAVHLPFHIIGGADRKVRGHLDGAVAVSQEYRSGTEDGRLGVGCVGQAGIHTLAEDPHRIVKALDSGRGGKLRRGEAV